MWVWGAFILGTLGLLMWYMRMFCDNPTAELWRSMGNGYRLRRILGTGRAAQNFTAVSFPAISTAILLMALAKCAESLGAPTWLIVSLVGVSMLLMIAAFIAIIPFKYPDCFYEDWQYAKRHGLLEEGKAGKKSSQNRDFGGVDRHVGTGVSVRVAPAGGSCRRRNAESSVISARVRVFASLPSERQQRGTCRTLSSLKLSSSAVKERRRSSTTALVAWLSRILDAASLTTPFRRIPPRVPAS